MCEMCAKLWYSTTDSMKTNNGQCGLQSKQALNVNNSARN